MVSVALSAVATLGLAADPPSWRQDGQGGWRTPMVEEAMTTPTQLIDLRTIVSRTGMSRMTIYRRMAAGEFPKPMKLGERINRWREADLEAWITARKVLHAAA